VEGEIPMHGWIEGHAGYRRVLAKNGRRYDFEGQLLSTPPAANCGSRAMRPSREMTDEWAPGLQPGNT
jgi:hypothetical protein